MLRAFVSYPYRPETQAFADAIREFLRQIDVEPVDGRWPDATIPLAEDITERIRHCDVLVSLNFENCPSRWADQEIGLAIGLGLDIIQITDSTATRSGLIAERFHISRAHGEFFVCAALANTVRCIKQKRATDLGPVLSSNAPLDEIDSEAWSQEERTTILRLRELFSESQFERIVRVASKASADHPRCWRFRVAQSAALTHLNKYEQADNLLDEVIEEFHENPRALSYAYDNKGGIESCRNSATDFAGVKRRLAFHLIALEHEKRVITYINVVECLLLLEKVDDAERKLVECLTRFPKALEAFRTQVKLKGTEFVQAVARSHLLTALLFPRQEGAVG